MPILSFEDQQLIKPISPNNEDRYDLIAIEVEDVDLLTLIGLPLLQDLQDNPTSEANEKLLSGSVFTNYRNLEVKHKGINYILAYFNYARYIGESFVADTFTGMVAKTRTDSERLAEGEIIRLQNSARKQAMIAWETVKEFLNNNYNDYPLWCSAKSNNPFTPKLKSVMKTVYSIESNDEKRNILNGKLV